MSKMQTITVPDFGDLEVDTEACSLFGFQAGDKVAPEGQEDKPATILGVAPIPDGIEVGCVDHNNPVLWVEGYQGEVCFIPPNLLAHIRKIVVN